MRFFGSSGPRSYFGKASGCAPRSSLTNSPIAFALVAGVPVSFGFELGPLELQPPIPPPTESAPRAARATYPPTRTRTPDLRTDDILETSPNMGTLLVHEADATVKTGLLDVGRSRLPSFRERCF